MNSLNAAAATNSSVLIPKQTPFNYNVGINYETWEVGRKGYSIENDLQQVTQDFKLIKTFHDVAVGTANPSNPKIDPTQQQAINFIKKTTDVELVMGTNTDALARLNPDGTWKPGLMYSKAYTDKWVDMVIESFGSKAQVKQHLKTILLSNEIDMQGPPPGHAQFKAYYQQWIPTAFDNLQASLSKKGLGGIPVTTTIANYGETNVVSVQVPKYINNHWKDGWNDGKPFVLFNQYTPGFSSTDFKHVESYFEGVQKQLPGKLEVFIGETGYSSFYGAKNQADVYKEMFSWLDSMRSQGGKTVPLFVFDAFDRPAYNPSQPQEVEFGIYGENANSQPTGLKPQLDGVIPSWTDAPINAKTAASDAYHGGFGAEAFAGGSGEDVLFGGGGSDTLRGNAHNDIIEGHDGNDTLLGHSGRDIIYGGTGRDRIGGGSGNDSLFGDAGDDSITGGRGRDLLEGGDGVDILRGEAGDDKLYGGAHADTLIGAGGEDLLVGGDGNDRINGGSGSDKAYGGEGNDTFFIETLGDLIVEHESGGHDEVRVSLDSYSLAPNVEDAVLSDGAGAAQLRGNSADNSLVGNADNNLLQGLQGDDVLIGKAGDDTLAGGGGINQLVGGSGEDLLRLGRRDEVWGGSGADSFFFSGSKSTSGDLMLMDFAGLQQVGTAEADKLVFSSGLESGSFAYRGSDSFSASGNSEARLAGGERLEIDSDGDGAVDVAATLSGFTNPNQLTATDFLWL